MTVRIICCSFYGFIFWFLCLSFWCVFNLVIVMWSWIAFPLIPCYSCRCDVYDMTCAVINECDLFALDWRNESVDLLVLETLVPKALLQQYVSLVVDSKRLVLSGPSGTGKSYLAARLAQHVVLR